MADISQQKLNKSLDFTLLKKRPTYTRLDVLSAPAIALIYYNIFGDVAFDWEHLLATVCLILSVTLVCLIFLLNYWSVNAHVFLSYQTLPNNDKSTIEICTHVRIRLENRKQHTVKRYIVPIIINKVATSSGVVNKVYQLEFSKKRLLYSSERKTFQAVPFPIKESIEFYRNSEGLANDQEERKALLVWGQNKLDIPIPKFFDVYKEHLVAPFFVFQIFCSALWLLDEYWYFSLFTLGMLFVFEGTVVMQRLQNMKRLRSMRVAPMEVWAHRIGRWVKVMSDELYPGEVVLLKKNPTVKKCIVPLDLLLLSGSAVVNEAILTGESQPLVKESIAQLDNLEETLDLKGHHRVHILNGGTEILQFIPNDDDDTNDCSHISKPPQDGLICFVLKNGFETKQGKLMRTILFSTERVSVESKETYLYLLILLCFALTASYYVLTEGLKDPDRSRQKLLLRCVLIITNVVPPELPMELSMAVNYSIIQLVKKTIFCTEPFRIPFAGKVDICCFDKTGTLTQNDLVVKGLSGVQIDSKGNNPMIELKDALSFDRHALLVLAGCHTLAMADDQLVGDPIEKQAFDGIKYKHDGKKTSLPQSGSGPKIFQFKRYLFESALKRMSTIVSVEESKHTSTEYKVLSKGAPEEIKKYLKDVPANYDRAYLKYVKEGARVLALAYKNLPKGTQEYYNCYKRDEAECDLTFCGFIISECPLKEDTFKVIEELKASQHEVKMITGDNQLTAAFIGQQLKFGPTEKALFASAETSQEIIWKDVDEKHVGKTSSYEDVAKLGKQFMLCINGDVLDVISTRKDISKVIKSIHVFSRTSPNQKDFIVGMLNKEGHITLMCGDGTNDVGSLKRANIGLAIINNKAPSKEDKQKRKGMSMWLKPADLQGLTPQQAREKQQKHMEDYMKTMQTQMGGPDSGMPELGDACIAAPFTYKFQSLKSTIKLIQQGRTTLTTTFQMYKILSLNSLISAYTMSALYLDGVKMGDSQATCMGMGISILFMLISFSKPLKRLEKARPPTSIFHWSLVISVSLQFAIHLTVLVILVRMCEPFIDRLGDESLVPDGEFKPNVKNSVLFLYQWWLQCTVITVNYSGRPFMENLGENTKLFRYICVMFAVAASGILDYSDIIREYLELVPFPNQDFQFTVIGLLMGDFAICWVIEKTIKRMYLKQFE